MRSKKVLSGAILFLYFLLFFQLSLIALLNFEVKQQVEPIVKLVKTLYEFSSPNELLQNQEDLKTQVSEELYDSLSIDNYLRVVNAYYKFGYTSSTVNIVEAFPNYVAYSLKNQNVSHGSLWVLVSFHNEGTPPFKEVQEYRVLHRKGVYLE